MKLMSTIFALAASALLLASCADPQSDRLPAELREIMEANRAIAMPPLRPDFYEIAAGLMRPYFDPEAVRWVASVERRPGAGSSHIMRRADGNLDLSAKLPHYQFAEEIRYIFGLMRYAWAAYQYFGGDDVFLPMRDAMLEQLALMSDPLPISAYLDDLLVPNLGNAIADNHFRIHGRTIGAPAHMLHINEDYVLRRYGEGFVAEIDGATHKVIATTLPDRTPVEGILPTITREGEFAFAFARLAVADGSGAIEIVAQLENAATGESLLRAISLPLPISAGCMCDCMCGTPNCACGLDGAEAQADRPPMALRDVGGIPVFENMRLNVRTGSPDVRDANQAAAAMRDSPVAILDIRGIGGGQPDLGLSWISGYASRSPNDRLLFHSFNMTPLNLMSRFSAVQAGLASFPPPGWIRPGPFVESAPIANENLLIVLMDRGAGSAGDRFAGQLRQLENALFVGTNTQGTLVTGRVIRRGLPYSGLDIVLGTELNLRPDLSLFEGVGFLPDLWVPPDESLERALAFVERYGLNR